jgi:hypothetical protein
MLAWSVCAAGWITVVVSDLGSGMTDGSNPAAVASTPTDWDKSSRESARRSVLADESLSIVTSERLGQADNPVPAREWEGAGTDGPTVEVVQPPTAKIPTPTRTVAVPVFHWRRFMTNPVL